MSNAPARAIIPTFASCHMSRIALARQQCPCDPAYGIAFVCPATQLPRIGDKMIATGPIESIPYPMPIKFECPRHTVMGW